MQRRGFVVPEWLTRVRSLLNVHAWRHEKDAIDELTLSSIGVPTAAVDFDGQNLVNTGTIRSEGSVWWREQHIIAASLAPGASGATLVEPGANTPGGYNLDADGEHLTFQVHLHDDWDGLTDPVFEVVFENDMAAGAVGTTAIIRLDTYSKGSGETAIKTQNLTDTTAVDDDAQYTQYEAELPLDYDAGGGNDADAGDVIGCHLWFDATNSVNLTDVIINHITFKYKTRQVLAEV